MSRTTAHADLRARKRLGISDVTEVFKTALTEGVRRKELKGTFARFMDKQSITHKSSFVIHRNVVYWFSGIDERLITVIPLHPKWHKYMKTAATKRTSAATTEAGDRE